MLWPNTSMSITVGGMTTAQICSPGGVLANIPGILGFYPTDSILLASFAKYRGSEDNHALTAVVRVDTGDIPRLNLAYDSISSQRTPDLVLIYLICPTSERDALAKSLWQKLQSLELPSPAMWHVEEIKYGERYKLMLPPTESYEAYSDIWRGGSLPRITESATMRNLIMEDELPMPSREDLLEIYTQDRIIEGFDEVQARKRAYNMGCLVEKFPHAFSVTDYLIPTETVGMAVPPPVDWDEKKTRKPVFGPHPQDDAHILAHDIASVIDRAEHFDFGRLCSDKQAMVLGALCCLDHRLSNVVLFATDNHIRAVGDWMLGVAKTTLGEGRARALTLYAHACIGRGLNSFAIFALNLALEEFPDDTLAQELLRLLYTEDRGQTFDPSILDEF